LKVGRFSVGWFMLVARLVRTRYCGYRSKLWSFVLLCRRIDFFLWYRPKFRLSTTTVGE